MKWLAPGLAVLLCAAGSLASAQDCACIGGAQRLYVYTSNGRLYAVDDWRGQPSATLLSDHAGGLLQDIAVEPATGVVFALRYWPLAQLWTLDPATGQLTYVGDTSHSTSILGIDFDAAGTLWARGSSGHVYTLDPATGASTLVTNPGGTQHGGFTLDPRGVQYATLASGRLDRYDLASGLRNTLAPHGVAEFVLALDSDCDGRLFGFAGQRLIEFDPETGLVLSSTPLGITGTAQGMAFARPAQESACVVGDEYCAPAQPNSTGAPGRADLFGSALVSDDFLTVRARDLPVGQPGYFLAGLTQGFVPFPGGSQGVLCIVGQVGRFRTQLAPVSLAGELGAVVDLTAIPTSPPRAAQAGETWHFQAWHRDLNPGPTSNFTSAVRLLFQ